jgi:probable HAF family extracellular repeat protein
VTAQDRPRKPRRRFPPLRIFGILLAFGLICLLAYAFLTPASLVPYEVTFVDPSDSRVTTFCLNNCGDVAGTFRTKDGAWGGYVRGSDGRRLEFESFGGHWTTPRGINDRRFVVGFADTLEDTRRAFLWNENDGMKDLGTLGGEEAYAYGINNRNTVVGKAQIEGGTWHAFVWDATRGMTGLATPDGAESSASDLDDSGQIVGSLNIRNTTKQAVLWTESGELVELGTLDGWDTYARFINESGVVVGEAMKDVQRCWRGFVWSATEGMRELEGLGGETTRARGLNDKGQVVGLSTRRWEYTPMEIQAWIVIEIGNRFNSDLAVGMADDLARRFDDAVVWDNGSVQRLQKKIQLGFDAGVQPYGINNSGQIIAYLHNWSGQRGYALLTPKDAGRGSVEERQRD